MLFLDFIKWWYGPGWAQRLTMLGQHLKNWLDYFSIGILFATMFSPWRQNISQARKDQALQAKLAALVDNLVSRMVGFFVRVFALIAAIVVLSFVTVFYLLVFVLWPILPLASIIIIAIGVSV